MTEAGYPHFAAVTAAAIRRLRRDVFGDPWAEARREAQTPPPGAWRIWLVMAGRGFGKTRTGAEFIREQVMAQTMRRIALVGPTAADVRDVMIEGESGLIPVCERYGFRPSYEPSKRRVIWPNGAVGHCYSAEEPDRLRGPQHDGAWADEVAAWAYAESWDNLQFGLRLGDPKVIATTTPKPVPVVKDVLAQRGTGTAVVTTGSTYDNAANLAPGFLHQIVRRYEGTRLGRQELLGELLFDVPGALWQAAQIEATRYAMPNALDLARVVIGVDPAASAGEDASETGIVVTASTLGGDGLVLEDASLHGSPAEWARAVVAAADRWGADRIVAEANNGGHMVEAVLRTVRPSLPITLVHASRGKLPRAEPVAALYEQGRVHHTALFPQLEDQMTTYDGSAGMRSPDRMDALVWALTDLMLTQYGDPGIAAAFADWA